MPLKKRGIIDIISSFKKKVLYIYRAIASLLAYKKILLANNAFLANSNRGKRHILTSINESY